MDVVCWDGVPQCTGLSQSGESTELNCWKLTGIREPEDGGLERSTHFLSNFNINHLETETSGQEHWTNMNLL